MKLLSIGHDAKTVKGESQAFITGIMYLAPARTSCVCNVCPWSTPGCRAACLNSAGRGRFAKTQAARIARTRLWHTDRVAFMTQLVREIEALVRKAARQNMTPCVR